MNDTDQPRRRMAEIAKAVAMRSGLQVDDLRNASRVRPLCDARQEAMLQMVEAGFTTTQVGRFLRRDHSTVVHGVQVARARRMEERLGL